MAPRPFPDEPFGGWFARVAGRYKMSVEQLWLDSGMDRPAASLNPVWLLWAGVGDANVDRLSWLARVEARSLSAIMSTVGWSLPAQAPYCYVCLVHNRADVTAPRWKLAWLAPDVSPCQEHDAWLTVETTFATPSRNFERLLTLIRRRYSRAQLLGH